MAELAHTRGKELKKTALAAEYKALLGRLILARKTAALTQHALAALLGKPQSFVSKYESGDRRLDVVEFVIIARALGVDATAIVHEMDLRLSARASRKVVG